MTTLVPLNLFSHILPQRNATDLVDTYGIYCITRSKGPVNSLDGQMLVWLSQIWGLKFPFLYPQLCIYHVFLSSDLDIWPSFVVENPCPYPPNMKPEIRQQKNGNFQMSLGRLNIQKLSCIFMYSLDIGQGMDKATVHSASLRSAPS